MPEFQRLVIWLHSDKKKNNNGKEKNKQFVQEYKTKREEKESVQYQNNLIYIIFNSMLHLVVSDQQLIQQRNFPFFNLMKANPNYKSIRTAQILIA